MEAISGILTAFGISGPAGLNAYLTVLIVGLIARFTDWLTLREPFTFLENEWFLGVMVILVLIELLVDKVPGLDTFNDVLGTIIRPLAGAILFAGTDNMISDIHPLLGAVLGLGTAGIVHLVKAAVRPPIQVATGGTGGAFVSAGEDFMVVLTVILAVVVPILAILLLLLFGFFAIRWYRRRRNRTALAS